MYVDISFDFLRRQLPFDRYDLARCVVPKIIKSQERARVVNDLALSKWKPSLWRFIVGCICWVKRSFFYFQQGSGCRGFESSHSIRCKCRLKGPGAFITHNRCLVYPCRYKLDTLDTWNCHRLSYCQISSGEKTGWGELNRPTHCQSNRIAGSDVYRVKRQHFFIHPPDNQIWRCSETAYRIRWEKLFIWRIVQRHVVLPVRSLLYFSTSLYKTHDFHALLFLLFLDA